ncbi:unnamed protein product [Rangifer tarandus platyrhynchus]|uniref:Uncharacterized protein n=1 Tax=Rangifer tarandus platyrhynchus TaxID=3082113 RepID=A0ABN8ZHH9_RANTA|nr:unnamed protein product [Rangifer tarandus platyrhynchus]
MGLVTPLPRQSHSLGAVPSCSPLPTGAGPGLILEQRKEAVISAPRSFLFSKCPSQLLSSKCTLSAAGAGREGSGLSLPVSGCFLGPLITAGSQRPRVQLDGAENLVMIPLSPRPQSEPGSSLFISRVCPYVTPAVVCVCVWLRRGFAAAHGTFAASWGSFHHSTQTLVVGSRALGLSCPVGGGILVPRAGSEPSSPALQRLKVK